MGGKPSIPYNTPTETPEGIILRGYFNDVFIEFLFTEASGYKIDMVKDANIEQAKTEIENSRKMGQPRTIKWIMKGFQNGSPFLVTNRWDTTSTGDPTFPRDFKDDTANNWLKALMEIAKKWGYYEGSDWHDDMAHTGFQSQKIF